MDDVAWRLGRRIRRTTTRRACDVTTTRVDCWYCDWPQTIRCLCTEHLPRIAADTFRCFCLISKFDALVLSRGERMLIVHLVTHCTVLLCRMRLLCRAQTSSLAGCQSSSAGCQTPPTQATCLQVSVTKRQGKIWLGSKLKTVWIFIYAKRYCFNEQPYRDGREF